MKTKIGKIKMFEGKFELLQTRDIRKYININFYSIDKNKYTLGKKPIIVELHEEGIWIKEDLFSISGGDIFKIIKNASKKNRK